jgi:hypothetical protein
MEFCEKKWVESSMNRLELSKYLRVRNFRILEESDQ